MIRVPSVNTIEHATTLDRGTSILVRRILDGRDNPKHLPGVAAWLRQCYNEPDQVSLKLAACDELLDTHGVEAIRATKNVDGYWGDIAALYCNTGDTYYSTVLYDTERGTFYITSYGDWIETAERTRRYKFV